MSAATDEQKKNLAEATLRLAREILRFRDGKDAEPDNDIGRAFGEALFECPADALADVPELLKALDPQTWLADVLARLPDYPARRISDLLPWNWRRPPRVAEAAGSKTPVITRARRRQASCASVLPSGLHRTRTFNLAVRIKLRLFLVWIRIGVARRTPILRPPRIPRTQVGVETLPVRAAKLLDKLRHVASQFRYPALRRAGTLPNPRPRQRFVITNRHNLVPTSVLLVLPNNFR